MHTWDTRLGDIGERGLAMHAEIPTPSVRPLRSLEGVFTFPYSSYRLSCSSIPVRQDDEVVVTRGPYKGQQGKVTQV